jgi:hypothetical protein
MFVFSQRSCLELCVHDLNKHLLSTCRNALVYGAKKWYLYPPHDMIMSNAQIKEFIEVEMPLFENRSDFKPVKAVTCVQTSGMRYLACILLTYV